MTEHEEPLWDDQFPPIEGNDSNNGLGYLLLIVLGFWLLYSFL